MSRPKNFLELYLDPKNCPLGPQKVKNYPKIKSKSKVRIEGTIENKSCSTTLVDPKKVIESFSNPKYSPLGPQKVKNDPPIKSKSNVRIQGNLENESCSTT